MGTFPDPQMMRSKLIMQPYQNKVLTLRPPDVPIFGCQYEFELKDAIQKCPEFLVHLPTFVSFAHQVHLEPRSSSFTNFVDFYNQHKSTKWGRNLLKQMQVAPWSQISHDQKQAFNLYATFCFNKQ